MTGGIKYSIKIAAWQTTFCIAAKTTVGYYPILLDDSQQMDAYELVYVLADNCVC